MNRIVKTGEFESRTRWIVIYQRSNGTFGFFVEKWAADEEARIQFGRRSECIVESVEAAEMEGLSCVAGFNV